MHTGDDEINIPPHDPSFFPGMFYISVFALRDSSFEIKCKLVEQEVRIRPPMPSVGNGYKEVKAMVALADTRRRFCQHGAGFKDQLDSPRSLHGSKPDAPSPRGGSARPSPRAAKIGGGSGGSVSASVDGRPSTTPAFGPRSGGGEQPNNPFSATFSAGEGRPSTVPDRSGRRRSVRSSKEGVTPSLRPSRREYYQQRR